MTHIDCAAIACGLVEYYGQDIAAAWAATMCDWRALVRYRFDANQLRKTKVRPLSRQEMDAMIAIDEAREAARAANADKADDADDVDKGTAP